MPFWRGCGVATLMSNNIAVDQIAPEQAGFLERQAQEQRSSPCRICILCKITSKRSLSDNWDSDVPQLSLEVPRIPRRQQGGCRGGNMEGIDCGRDLSRTHLTETLRVICSNSQTHFSFGMSGSYARVRADSDEQLPKVRLVEVVDVSLPA